MRYLLYTDLSSLTRKTKQNANKNKTKQNVSYGQLTVISILLFLITSYKIVFCNKRDR